ncbi:S10 family peptidase [Sphingomonas nostoxanthinifaciens]|uniref:S10 family peptidase n=1 Tax=Sphingomonas nostoxanthinifaciens TaxID=2872652 RepID=UPI001CC2194D|nr:peptidase S10 [Sphingomonas nostoxanthinifaciens]UAK25353.1 peptidase S10 [Sphingomonas nostoxanthinifaciens]
MRLSGRLLAFASILPLAFAPALSAPKPDDKKAASEAPAAKGPDKADMGDKPNLLPFPVDRSIKQVTHVAGKTIAYTATVGSLPVRDADGKKTGEVVFTAYTLDGPRDPSRPITFAFNGGPGAASVYLNLGAIGPKRVQFGAAGDAPSDPAVLRDNPGTWLDFTDLVFIDPVGTGFSRSLLKQDETDKTFFTIEHDIQYLSRIVYDWLQKNGRMTSPKYVVGESYGGYRAPAIAHTLQTDMGVGVSGVVMVSPALDGRAEGDPDLSPMGWVATLPSMAAANYERQGKPLNPETMNAVETYARTEFVTDLLSGRADTQATARLVKNVTTYTGLDPRDVQQMGGRIESREFLRALYRTTGKLGSWYDSNVTAYDPFPWSPRQRTGDPILEGILAPTTSAMVDFVTNQVGWKVDAHYEALNGSVNEHWEKNWFTQIESASDLRQALAVDPKMKAMIVHGYDDLSCPYFQSKLIVAQIPEMGGVQRVKVNVYPGGHMFYSRSDSQAAFRRDVMALYGVR